MIHHVKKGVLHVILPSLTSYPLIKGKYNWTVQNNSECKSVS